MNILLLLSHDIAEYDDLRMLSDLGYDVFSIGAYTDPPNTPSTARPPLDIPAHPDLAARCEEQREKHRDDPMQVFTSGQTHNIIDWAKADLHQDVIDWADVIICHHYLESWIVRQWDRLREKRVIWRTCGQSNAFLEETMGELHKDGLQIVRYSPAEERAFSRLGVYAGADTLIRFGKYPSDYGPWIGDDLHVGNITQNMAGRGEFCGYPFWLRATQGLPVKPAGIDSDGWMDNGIPRPGVPGGIGALSYPDMLDYLRHIRTYLYTGTQPASYTLALIEAMLSGVPIVSMPSDEWWIPDLFEGPELVEMSGGPNATRSWLAQFIADEDKARAHGDMLRQKAVDLFGIEKIGRQWLDLLGSPVTVTYDKATAA